MKHFQLRVDDEFHAKMEELRENLGLPSLQALGEYAIRQLMERPATLRELPAAEGLTHQQMRLLKNMALLLRGWPEMLEPLETFVRVLMPEKRPGNRR